MLRKIICLKHIIQIYRFSANLWGTTMNVGKQCILDEYHNGVIFDFFQHVQLHLGIHSAGSNSVRSSSEQYLKTDVSRTRKHSDFSRNVIVIIELISAFVKYCNRKDGSRSRMCGVGQVRWFGCTVIGAGVLKAAGAGDSAGDSGASASASRSVTSSSSMMEMSRMDGRCERRQPVKQYPLLQ